MHTTSSTQNCINSNLFHFPFALDAWKIYAQSFTTRPVLQTSNSCPQLRKTLTRSTLGFLNEWPPEVCGSRSQSDLGARCHSRRVSTTSTLSSFGPVAKAAGSVPVSVPLSASLPIPSPLRRLSVSKVQTHWNCALCKEASVLLQGQWPINQPEKSTQKAPIWMRGPPCQSVTRSCPKNSCVYSSPSDELTCELIHVYTLNHVSVPFIHGVELKSLVPGNVALLVGSIVRAISEYESEWVKR